MNRGARYANLALGAWLLISAFLWPHSPAQFRNTWSVASLCIVVATLGVGVPALRRGNTVLGLWCLASAFITSSLGWLTVLNNAVVGAAIVLFSLVPSASSWPPPSSPSSRT
jgi:hypothetical protein